jgi:hypothetical protein
LVRIGADFAHQRQRFAIGTEQDVLAVVQRASVDFHRARPAARHASGFNQGDGGAASGQFNRSGQSRPAGADDGDAHRVSP